MPAAFAAANLSVQREEAAILLQRVWEAKGTHARHGGTRRTGASEAPASDELAYRQIAQLMRCECPHGWLAG